MDNSLKIHLCDLAEKFDPFMRKIEVGTPVGLCFLVADVFDKAFRWNGIKSRVCVGDLGLMDSKGSWVYDGPEISYGSMGTIWGKYHAWVEIFNEGKWLIFDPTVRYTAEVLPDFLGIKLHPDLPKVILSEERIGPLFRYISNPTSVFYYNEDLHSIPERIMVMLLYNADVLINTLLLSSIED